MEINVTDGGAKGSPPSASSNFFTFEVVMFAIAVVSFMLVRRRRRQQEMKALQRYERLSRVEMVPEGSAPSVDGASPTGVSASAGTGI
jgi:hypothetical protein